MEKWPNCSHTLGSPLRTEKKTIFDIAPPQKVKVTECDIDICKCSNCGTELRSKLIDGSQKGDMGVYLLIYITMLKYNLRGPIRRIQEFLVTNNNLDLRVKGINDALLRVGDAGRSEYTAIRDRISRSKWIHIDETGFHVNGKKYWLWTFRSAENDILIIIVDSRGRGCCEGDHGREFPFSCHS